MREREWCLACTDAQLLKVTSLSAHSLQTISIRQTVSCLPVVLPLANASCFLPALAEQCIRNVYVNKYVDGLINKLMCNTQLEDFRTNVQCKVSISDESLIPLGSIVFGAVSVSLTMCKIPQKQRLQFS